ncbi:MAG: ATP-binding protein, partial [Candidatus Omnitrophica bacterium]|nr:ATP-binding protein [Candidatus Omnitrophota bacterium]
MEKFRKSGRILYLWLPKHNIGNSLAKAAMAVEYIIRKKTFDDTAIAQLISIANRLRQGVGRTYGASLEVNLVDDYLRFVQIRVNIDRDRRFLEGLIDTEGTSEAINARIRRVLDSFIFFELFFEFLLATEEPEPSLFSLNELVRGLITEFSDSDARIVYEEDMHVVARRPLITQILYDLLYNAEKSFIRCSRKEKVVALAISGSSTWAQVVISDNGWGMTEDVLSHLFIERYSAAEYGSGLGLLFASLVIVQVHGGAIIVISRAKSDTDKCASKVVVSQEGVSKPAKLSLEETGQYFRPGCSGTYFFIRLPLTPETDESDSHFGDSHQLLGLSPLGIVLLPVWLWIAIFVLAALGYLIYRHFILPLKTNISGPSASNRRKNKKLRGKCPRQEIAKAERLGRAASFFFSCTALTAIGFLMYYFWPGISLKAEAQSTQKPAKQTIKQINLSDRVTTRNLNIVELPQDLVVISDPDKLSKIYVPYCYLENLPQRIGILYGEIPLQPGQFNAKFTIKDAKVNGVLITIVNRADKTRTIILDAGIAVDNAFQAQIRAKAELENVAKCRRSSMPVFRAAVERVSGKEIFRAFSRDFTQPVMLLPGASISFLMRRNNFNPDSEEDLVVFRSHVIPVKNIDGVNVITEAVSVHDEASDGTLHIQRSDKVIIASDAGVNSHNDRVQVQQESLAVGFSQPVVVSDHIGKNERIQILKISDIKEDGWPYLAEGQNLDITVPVINKSKRALKVSLIILPAGGWATVCPSGAGPRIVRLNMEHTLETIILKP